MSYFDKGLKYTLVLSILSFLILVWKLIFYRTIESNKILFRAEALFYKAKRDKSLFSKAYRMFCKAEEEGIHFSCISLLHYGISAFYAKKQKKAKHIFFRLKERIKDYSKKIGAEFLKRDLIIPLLSYLSFFYMKDKKYSLALNWYKKLHYYLPYEPIIWYNIAWIYTQQGDFASASSFILKLINAKEIKEELKLKVEELIKRWVG